jgi:hypothetical protein
MADVRTIKAGDRGFSAENFNRLVRNDRAQGKVSTDKYIRLNQSPMGQHFALNRRELVPFWRMSKHATSGSSGPGGLGIKCTSGAFQFNGRRLTTSETLLDRSKFSGTNTRYWLYISTSEPGGNYDPYIHPTAATVHVSASGQKGMDQSFGDNKRFPLGYVDVNSQSAISNIVQPNDGPFVVNNDTPDGELRSASHPVRRTLERNPADNLHKGEWQLYDVDAVKVGGTGMPTFTPDGDGDAVLFWMYPDTESQRATDQKSFETRTTASGTIFQLYDFHGNTGSSMNKNDLVLFKSVDNNDLRKMTKAALGNWLSSSGGGSSDGGGGIRHTGLVFTGSTSGTAGTNIDHRPEFWYNYNDDSFVSARDFRTTGEVHADDFKIQDDPDNNIWNAARLKVSTSSSDGISLTSNGGPLTIDLPSQSLQIDGNTGQSVTLQVTQNGTTRDITFTKGVLTNVSS